MIALIVLLIILVILLVVTVTLLIYFCGFPKCVGKKKYHYRKTKKIISHDGINVFGVLLTPINIKTKCPLVIYAHGAESNYKSDYTTLVSLAMSGVMVYTFDFYGWSKRTKGPIKGAWFKKHPRSDDAAYENKVKEQAKELDAIIACCKTFDNVDIKNIYLLGSSMGGATAALASINHSKDIKGLILQFPAVNLTPQAFKDNSIYSFNKYENKVLVLQGIKDTIVPLTLSERLVDYYNQSEKNHAKLIIYPNEKHVFKGKYKVVAAKDIFDFIQEE